MDPRKPIFDAVRAAARPGLFDDSGYILALDNLLDAFGVARAQLAAPATKRLTVRILTEIMGHEAIVLEAYKDSKGIWTWGVGVTDASGHSVARYKDKPQTIGRCLEIYVWLLAEKYLPAVLKAFGGRPLTEAQLCAALSFHYNTGAIGRADWVKSWLAGDVAKARAEFMNWRNPPEIVKRREEERDLFFDGTWASDGFTTVWPVKKPSYRPDWSRPSRTDVRPWLEKLVLPA